MILCSFACTCRTTLMWHLVACTLVGLVVWLALIYSVRYTLKILLMYKGWMYEQRGKGRVISVHTRIWLLFVKILSGGTRPLLYSFQGSLPRLPLPSLRDTMQRVSCIFILLYTLKHSQKAMLCMLQMYL